MNRVTLNMHLFVKFVFISYCCITLMTANILRKERFVSSQCKEPRSPSQWGRHGGRSMRQLVPLLRSGSREMSAGGSSFLPPIRSPWRGVPFFMTTPPQSNVFANTHLTRHIQRCVPKWFQMQSGCSKDEPAQLHFSWICLCYISSEGFLKFSDFQVDCKLRAFHLPWWLWQGLALHPPRCS